MADYIIQKAVSTDAVKKANRRTLEEYGQAYLAQPKCDGCCAIMTLRPDHENPITGIGVSTQSRTGEPVYSMGNAEDQCVAQYSDVVETHGGIVLIGEAWWPGKDQFSTISGEFRRQSNFTGHLGFIINDVLTLAEFEAGYSPWPYTSRMARLDGCDEEMWCGRVTSFPPGSYGDPQALCNEWVAKGGYDGLILRDPRGTWTRGRGTTGEIIKVKQVLSFDLRVIGGEPGKGKHEGRLGALIVDFGGKQLRVGTGFTDEQRYQFYEGSNDILGQIVEIEAMDYSSDGLLREPRFKGIRHDKIEPDRIAA